MSDSAPIPALDGTVGTTLIGGVLGTFLFGIATLQAFNYYRQYPKDNRILKTLVAVIWFLELGHSICVWHGLYTMTVTFYGQPAHLANPPHSLPMSILFTALILAPVQTFFAYRIKLLSGRWPITILCSVLTTMRFAFSIVLIEVFWTSPGFAVLHEPKGHWVYMMVVALGPTVDIIIAVSLCYLLWKIRREGSQFTQTRRLLDTLILWTVETTTVTSVAGIMQLLLFLVRKDLAWMVFYLIQPKLFSNSLLASLNNRQTIRSANKGDFLSLGASTDGTRSQGLVIQMHRVMETSRPDVSYPKAGSGIMPLRSLTYVFRIWKTGGE
ncbi:hypothetical protein C8R47DRAFT_1165222 [Mycena vitilis]|nr:hypothetical protein C8R47DRAFT_1165222 [Mycena vitilis]